MTSLELIPVPSGTVIRSQDGGESMSVQPGAPVWKGMKLFMAPEDFTAAFELLQQAFGPKGE